MSAFGIFAIVLTSVYVVYFGVMLAYDQYGVKGQKKDDVEVFDRPAEDFHDRSRHVRENGDGSFTVTDESPEEESPVGDGLFDAPPDDSYQDDDNIDITSGDDDGVVDDDDVVMPGDSDDGDDNSVYNRLKQIQEELPAIVPSYEEEYDSAGMYVVMSQPLEVQTHIRRELLRI